MSYLAESEYLDQDSNGNSEYDVCVLGTSNAVMKDGYVDQIAQEPMVRSVVNLSVGGSSSNLFTYRRSEFVARKFDVAIADFCINDTTLYASRLQNVVNIRESLEEMFVDLATLVRVPVMLMLPLRSGGDNPVPDIYRDVAKQYGIPVFDGYRAIQGIKEFTGRAQDELFDDPFHLKRNLAKCIASWMIGGISAYRRALTKVLDRRGESATTRYVPINKMARAVLPQVLRTTTLLSERFCELDEGVTVDLDIPDDYSVVAFVADFANSRGVLSFSGRNNSRICLSSLDLVEGGGGFVLKAWPLPKAIFPHRGLLRLNVLNENEASADVSLNHPLSGAQLRMPVKIAIAGLILRIEPRHQRDYRSACWNQELSETESARYVALASAGL